ncbi:hypothetical protein [Paenibacillus daejeonensis]|uniref:hypothetical protein n=1 Tax=Paenibacillus daejeonensis TaxID=135193 RepID=UPI00036BA74C|nr:hypothetical protein [Paenibacillus daejeonensis]
MTGLRRSIGYGPEADTAGRHITVGVFIKPGAKPADLYNLHDLQIQRLATRLF